MNQKLKLGIAALAGMVATLAAGGIAMANMDHGLGHFRGVDADGNGEISRTEWLKSAGVSFDRLDANKDGKLIVGEIPRGGPGGPGGPGHGRHGHHGGPDFDDDFAPAPAAQPAPAEGNTTAPAAK